MSVKYQVILYDFDFTLADSSQGVVECVNYALNCMGIPSASANKIKESIGLSLSLILSCVTEQAVTPAQVETFRKHFIFRADQVMADKTYLLPHVSEVVRLFHQRGIRQGIVSNKFRYRIENVIQRDGIRECFTAIVGSEDTIHHKPDPGGLLTALERLNWQPDRTVYVGDHLVDAQAAQQAKIPFVGVLTGTTVANEFCKYPHLAIIEDLTQLPMVLGVDNMNPGRREHGCHNHSLRRAY